MTSVLPPWKLELLEKKKKKEQDQRQKFEIDKARNEAIPEWKRSLLEKRKECASDSPETGGAEQQACSSVNSVFGPRILRKASDKTIAIAAASQRPASQGEEEQLTKKRVSQHHEKASNAAVTKSNTCVTKAVGIPADVEHRGNERGCLQRGFINDDNNSQRSDIASPGDDLKVNLSSDATVDDDHSSTVSSVLALFEQSKPGNYRSEIINSASVPRSQSYKTDSESEKKSSASKFESEQAHISNKGSVNNAQSAMLRKSTGVRAPEIQEHKTSNPSYSIAPKPYKNFVPTPPWLKNSLPRNMNFQPGKMLESTLADKTCKDLQEPDQNGSNESPHRGNVEKTSTSSDEIISAASSEPATEKASTSEFTENVLQNAPRDHQTAEENSIDEQSHAQEETSSEASFVASDSQKYVLISNKNQQDLSANSKTSTGVSQENNFVPFPQESLHFLGRSELSHESSLDSLRSKFGPSVGYQRRTSSEENLFKKSNQSQPIKHEGVLHRTGKGKRNQSTMVRWSTDVLSLMSQPLDDSDLTLSVRSESKIPSASNSQGQRPPPPTKRWTADVLSVASVQTVNDAPEVSPRSDSSVGSSPGNSLDRVRSSSLSDVREEHGGDYFQHKANVSQGIEHRMHKLIRKASISENILNMKQEDSDSLSDEASSEVTDEEFSFKEEPIAVDALKNEVVTDHKITDSSSHEKDSKPIFSPRKHSISQNIEHKLCELFHRQLSQESYEAEFEGERTEENNFQTSTDKVVENIAVLTLEEVKEEPKSMILVDRSSPNVSPRLGDEPQKELDEIEPDSKATEGSVHKLSALFGSSILRGKKKDKSSSEKTQKSQERPETKPYEDTLSTKKKDGKKSFLFGKSRKSEKKNKEKDSYNENNISSLLKSCEKEKDKGIKTVNVQKTSQKRNSDISSKQDFETVETAVHGLQPATKTDKTVCEVSDHDINALQTAAQRLRPVHKAEKVHQRQLVGKMMIISNAGYEYSRPKGVYHKQNIQPHDWTKGEMSKESNVSKSVDIGRCKAEIPVHVTRHLNGEQRSTQVDDKVEESIPVTSIDEVPVSAIDIPEVDDNDVVVSVIDIPTSTDVQNTGKFTLLNGTSKGTPRADDNEDDVSVSVIDLPSPIAKEDEPSIPQSGYLETDEVSDGSDSDEVEGSYDFYTGEVSHLLNGSHSQESDEESDDDDDDVPVSYIGASPCYQVPQVVFDSEPVALKSCLSPKSTRKKLKARVSFTSSHTVHDYPSEEALTAVYDELQENNGAPLKTLQNYQPSSLVNMEKMLAGDKQEQKKVAPAYSNGVDDGHDVVDVGVNHSEIKYTDEGQGFTDSTDYASALLF
ncbi:hypothetical protein P5673_008889 [Acropora cervicornis]|uniref:Uncharacterized protein n=1 Tax=Acropora cervicornis TaxID=6130 RepID=A0AAD9VAR7_ACRCE|nr:hypothetical protein P5673_008889 [Acropora cervicornis]